jgi:acyl carrier protein
MASGGSEVLIDLKRVSLNVDGFYWCLLDVRSPEGTTELSQEQQTDKSSTFAKTPAFERKKFKFRLPDDAAAEDLRFDMPIRVYRASRDDKDNFQLYASQTVDIRFDATSQMSVLDDGKARRIHRRAFLTRNIANLGVHKEQGKIEFDVTVREIDSKHEPEPFPVQSRVNVSVDNDTIPEEHELETRESSPGLDFPDISAIPGTAQHPSVQEYRPASRIELSPSPTSGPLSSIRSIGRNTALHTGLAGDSLQVIPESLTGDGDEVESPTLIQDPDGAVTGSSPMGSKMQQQYHTSASPHFPASSAVSRILPQYSSLSHNQGDKLLETREYKPLEIPPDTPKPVQHSDNEPSDLRSMAIIERLTKELEDYRLGIQKMGNDIVHMREKIAKLEQEKTFLRQDLEGQDKAAQALVDEAELDSLDRVDLIRRHVKLCQRFGSEVKRSREYSQRVQKLQNEIIKKNDQEKGLLKIQQAHTAQQALVQKLQEHLERSRKYKETCRQQEKVS